MDVANNWKDYEILDMANGEKLERWGNITLIRPDPQIIWKEKSFPEKWKNANAKYNRSNTGGGNWNFIKPLPVSNSVCIETIVSGVGKRSAEIFAKVIGEDLATGERYLAATAFLTFVVVDENAPDIPQLEAETEEERYIMKGYAERRKKRSEDRLADREFQENISIEFPWG